MQAYSDEDSFAPRRRSGKLALLRISLPTTCRPEIAGGGLASARHGKLAEISISRSVAIAARHSQPIVPPWRRRRRQSPLILPPKASTAPPTHERLLTSACRSQARRGAGHRAQTRW